MRLKYKVDHLRNQTCGVKKKEFFGTYISLGMVSGLIDLSFCDVDSEII